MMTRVKDAFLVLGMFAVYGPRMIVTEIKRRLEGQTMSKTWMSNGYTGDSEPAGIVHEGETYVETFTAAAALSPYVSGRIFYPGNAGEWIEYK